MTRNPLIQIDLEYIFMFSKGLENHCFDPKNTLILVIQNHWNPNPLYWFVVIRILISLVIGNHQNSFKPEFGLYKDCFPTVDPLPFFPLFNQHFLSSLQIYLPTFQPFKSTYQPSNQPTPQPLNLRTNHQLITTSEALIMSSSDPDYLNISSPSPSSPPSLPSSLSAFLPESFPPALPAPFWV